MGSICQCVLLPEQPGKANITSHIWDQACAPRPKWPASSWHPFRTTFLCTAGKSNWKRVSSDSLGLAHLYRMSCFSNRWLCSCRNCPNLCGSVGLDCCCPRVPSQSLEMTRFRVCWAWCQFSKAIQVSCWLSLDCVQNVQIITVGLNRTCWTFESSLLHSSHGCSCDFEMCTWVVRHASWPGYLHKASASMLAFLTQQCNWEIVVH